MREKEELIKKIEELANEARMMNEKFISDVLQAILDVKGKSQPKEGSIPVVFVQD